jgi:hypothetical protein
VVVVTLIVQQLLQAAQAAAVRAEVLPQHPLMLRLTQVVAAVAAVQLVATLAATAVLVLLLCVYQPHRSQELLQAVRQ